MLAKVGDGDGAQSVRAGLEDVEHVEDVLDELAVAGGQPGLDALTDLADAIDGPPTRRVRLSAPLRRQRLPRAAHPSHAHPDTAPASPGRPGAHPQLADGPTCREVLAACKGQDRLIRALVTLAPASAASTTANGGMSKTAVICAILVLVTRRVRSRRALEAVALHVVHVRAGLPDPG